jgi:hypothetical protein
VPVGSVRSRLDWASPTVAPPMSDTANTTMPISRQVAALDRKNSRPHAEAPQLPPRLNLLDLRLRQRDARTAVPSIDMSLIEIPQCSGVLSDGGCAISQDPICAASTRTHPVARSPCLRRGPLSLDDWAGLQGDLWR